MLAKYRLRVCHKNASGTSRFDFPRTGKVAAWNHYHLYECDVERGYFDRVEFWERSDHVVATGEEGEEVWQLVQTAPKGD